MLHSGEYRYADVETAAAGYATRFSGDIGEWLLSVQDRALRRLLSQTKSASIIDVGGGHGQLLRVTEGLRITPLIIGSHFDAFSRLALSASWYGLVADLSAIPILDQAADTVVCVRLLSHCEQWQTLVRELCRLANRFVIVEYPPRAGLNMLYPLLYRVKSKSEGNTRRYLSFAQGDIDRAFSESGFKRIQRIGQFCLPMFLHRRMKNTTLSSVSEHVLNSIGLATRIGNPMIALYRRV